MTDLLDDIGPVEVDATWREVEALTVYLAEGDAIALAQLAVLFKMAGADVLVELLRRAAPSPNGTSYEVTCFGCGKKYTVKRRPVPGRRTWCDTCRVSGEPAAQRARDYRSRKETK